MTFLHPLLIGGAALIAVPIILHLIMRQQPRHLEFPALRFIRKRQDSNRRSMRLRHFLLLALRCAAVALLAAALARPTIQTTGMLGSQEAPVAAALVFDTNPRLDYRHQNNSRLATAQETALWLMAQLPYESEVAVVDSRLGTASFAIDMGAAKQRIERLTSSAVTLPLSTVIDDALRLVAKSDKQRKELYVFTDLSRSAWSPTEALGLQKQLKEIKDVGIYLIDVGVKSPTNLSLSELRLSGQVLSKNTPLRVATDVGSAGPGGQRIVELFLTEPGAETPTKRSQESVTIGADESQSVEFRLGGLTEGVHQGFVRIQGEDGLACDDVRSFTVEVKPAWKILLAAPEPTNDYALFLREALAPYAIRVKKEAAFECDAVSVNDLPKLKLAEYNAVCLLDPTPLPGNVWQQLGDFVAAGGGLAIFLGRNASPVDSFNEPGAQELLPGKLVRQWRSGEVDVYLSPDSLQHPMLSKFRSMESSIPWDSFPVFRQWELDKLNLGAAVIMPFSNQIPAILERPLGKGRAITMTTPVSDAASREDTWNLIPTGEEPWPFVMLANEMLYYLVGSREVKLNYLAGETASLPLSARDYRPIFSIKPPKGEPLRQAVDEQQHSLVVSSTETPGNYAAVASGDSNVVRLGFSTNLPESVSVLDQATADDLKAIFGDTQFRLAHNREEIDRSVSIGRVGRELYPILIVLLALALGLEMILANRFYRHPPAEKATAAELVAAVKQSNSQAVASTKANSG